MPHSANGPERAATRVPAADDHGAEGLAINPAIERLTRLLALCGGVLLLLAIALTLISVAGRYSFNAPLPGDFELVEMTAAVGIFFFLPYAHATNSNIVVRFFTDGMKERSKRLLDLGHDVLFSAVAALIAWRLAIGLADKLHTGESTMLVRIPYWWSYALAVASIMLLCIVCLARIYAGVRALRR
jgi:TRAP-type C4-dicarboxylate transport system permease small subunit